MRRLISVFLVSLFTLVCYGKKDKVNVDKPNVIVILIDDEGYGDVGCYGATGFQTPNIDKMAGEGMRFTQFYAAQPVCSASRAGLMTGCYPNRIGFWGALFPDHKIGLNKKEYTMAEMFKDQGYATACVGKWHLGWQKEFLPLQHGFDDYLGLPYSNDMWPRSDLTGKKLSNSSRKGKFQELPLIDGNETIQTITTMEDQNQLTSIYTQRAVDFIDQHAQEPFFLYAAHTMAHIPLGVSDRFKGKSKQGLYGDVMMEIDWSVGEIIQALDKNDLKDNTIVVFTTDNGPWLSFGNHAGSAGGLREGKTTSWDGGQRVPFIIQWPGHIPKGSVCNQLACAVDLLPSFASIIGGELSENKIDGLDISSLFKGDFDSAPRESILYYYGKNNLNAVRKGDWKLVLPHTYKAYGAPGMDGRSGKRSKTTIDNPELYDMRRDPGERFNVIETNPDKVLELMEIVQEARRELGDLNVGIDKGSENREIGQLTE